MNLVQAREKVGDLRARRYQSDDAKRQFRLSVMEPALKQLSSDCPEAFVPAEERSIVLRDETDATLGRTLAATTDVYVLDFGAVALAGASPIVTDGSWDAVYYLEITDAKGEVFHRRCVEFFSAGLISRYYVTIDHPWRNSTDTGMKFRLYQPYFYTRDDTTEIVDGRVFDARRQMVLSVPAGAVRLYGDEDYKGQTKGAPERLSRWGFEKLESPNRAPVAAAPNQDPPVAWLGPEPPGDFVYCYTYVWGKRDFELSAPGGIRDPMLESAPSPVSNTVVVPSMANAVVLSGLVDIDYQRNFNPQPAQLRNGHGGWRKRIYRARSKVTAGVGTIDNIEYPENVFFFLDEVDGSVTTYTDNGSKTPDYHRRLPESHGYFRWVLTPHADAKYTVDWRVYRRPGPLLADTDVPPVRPDFEDLLLTLLLKYAALTDRMAAEAQNFEAEFKEKLGKYRAKDANPAPLIQPVSWDMTVWGDFHRYGLAKTVRP